MSNNPTSKEKLVQIAFSEGREAFEKARSEKPVGCCE